MPTKDSAHYGLGVAIGIEMAYDARWGVPYENPGEHSAYGRGWNAGFSATMRVCDRIERARRLQESIDAAKEEIKLSGINMSKPQRVASSIYVADLVAQTQLRWERE